MRLDKFSCLGDTLQRITGILLTSLPLNIFFCTELTVHSPIREHFRLWYPPTAQLCNGLNEFLSRYYVSNQNYAYTRCYVAPFYVLRWIVELGIRQCYTAVVIFAGYSVITLYSLCKPDCGITVIVILNHVKLLESITRAILAVEHYLVKQLNKKITADFMLLILSKRVEKVKIFIQREQANPLDATMKR